MTNFEFVFFNKWAINKCLPAFVYNVQISLKLFMYM